MVRAAWLFSIVLVAVAGCSESSTGAQPTRDAGQGRRTDADVAFETDADSRGTTATLLGADLTFPNDDFPADLACPTDDLAADLYPPAP